MCLNVCTHITAEIRYNAAPGVKSVLSPYLINRNNNTYQQTNSNSQSHGFMHIPTTNKYSHSFYKHLHPQIHENTYIDKVNMHKNTISGNASIGHLGIYIIFHHCDIPLHVIERQLYN